MLNEITVFTEEEKKLIEYLLGLYVPSRVQPIENGSRKQLYHTHTTSETKINEAV